MANYQPVTENITKIVITKCHNLYSDFAVLLSFTANLTIQYNTIQYSTIQYNTMQYNAKHTSVQD